MGRSLSISHLRRLGIELNLVNWRRVVWITIFTYVMFNQGCLEFDRPIKCNPMILETCE
jgi:hypothetical protein